MLMKRLLYNTDELVKTHAPLKKISKREIKFRNKPWISGKIQKMMRIRDNLLKKIKKNNNQSFVDLFKQFRNRIAVHCIKISPIISKTSFKKNSNTMKPLWSGIRSIISIRESNSVNIIYEL